MPWYDYYLFMSGLLTVNYCYKNLKTVFPEEKEQGFCNFLNTDA